jgi:AbrB family looped-hinge helix DNA binding protein
MFTVRLSTKGQIVIPKEIREHLHFREGDTLTMEVQEDMVILRRLNTEDWRR